MKKCPNCQRTFEDSMRFCQADGTPLVDDAPAPDPYKTMVASPGEISAAMAGESSQKVDDEVLQLPENDPKKTMYASEAEIRQAMEANNEPVIDLPPLEPEPPRSSEPSLSPPSFGDVTPSAPPPSPFAPSGNNPISSPAADSPFNRTTPPIPSPFDNPKPSTYTPPEEFKPAAEPLEDRAARPFEAMPSAPIEPAASSPEGWRPPEASAGGSVGAANAGATQNKTLAIVSLVAGILGLTVCCGSFLPSLLAIILGFMAKKKASADPANFAGGGLATGGIITGVLGLLVAIVITALYFFGALAGVMGRNF